MKLIGGPDQKHHLFIIKVWNLLPHEWCRMEDGAKERLVVDAWRKKLYPQPFTTVPASSCHHIQRQHMSEEGLLRAPVGEGYWIP